MSNKPMVSGFMKNGNVFFTGKIEEFDARSRAFTISLDAMVDDKEEVIFSLVEEDGLENVVVDF